MRNGTAMVEKQSNAFPGDNKLSRREDTVYWTETRVEKQAPSFCQSTALTNRTANLYTNF